MYIGERDEWMDEWKSSRSRSKGWSLMLRLGWGYMRKGYNGEVVRERGVSLVDK